MKKATLLVLLCFGCATVREPVGQLRDEAVAEPQVELLLESGEGAQPQERADAEARAKLALQSALHGHVLAPEPLGAKEPLLLARERSVTRTDSRRHAQTAAKVGIVVGIVVVVAVVIAIALSGKEAPKAPAAKAPAPSAPAVKVPAAHAAAAGAAAGAPRPHAVPVPSAGTAPAPHIAVAQHLPQHVLEHPYWTPAPGPYIDPFWFWFDVSLRAEPGPVFYRDDSDEPLYAAPESPGSVLADAPPPPEADGPSNSNANANLDTNPNPNLDLPPPPEFAETNDRGFFSGDETVLQLALLDKSTGKLLWTNTVHTDGDPLDPDDMKKLVDQALAGQSWALRSH